MCSVPVAGSSRTHTQADFVGGVPDPRKRQVPTQDSRGRKVPTSDLRKRLGRCAPFG
jgi:hypothetical protein